MKCEKYIGMKSIKNYKFMVNYQLFIYFTACNIFTLFLLNCCNWQCHLIYNIVDLKIHLFISIYDYYTTDK